MPALSHYFNLTPPGVYDLTGEEIHAYLEELEAMKKKREG